MSDIWFTSDWHIGHKNIIKYCSRPFTDVQHMNEELIARHNAVVKPEDTVINVGDFALDHRVVEPTLKRLHGNQILVYGNHDRLHPAHRKYHLKWEAEYIKYGFAEVHLSMNLDVAGQSVHVCHMPYISDDRHGERYAEYRPRDDGRFQICGHVHQLWKINERCVNVSVDVWNFAPVHIDQIEVIMWHGGSELPLP